MVRFASRSMARPTLLTVIQAYESVAGFEEDGEWMEPKIPRLVPVLASPPDLSYASRRRLTAFRLPMTPPEEEGQKNEPEASVPTEVRNAGWCGPERPSRSATERWIGRSVA
jgi:hypothetical protein